MLYCLVICYVVLSRDLLKCIVSWSVVVLSRDTLCYLF